MALGICCAVLLRLRSQPIKECDITVRKQNVTAGITVFCNGVLNIIWDWCLGQMPWRMSISKMNITVMIVTTMFWAELATELIICRVCFQLRDPSAKKKCLINSLRVMIIAMFYDNNYGSNSNYHDDVY